MNHDVIVPYLVGVVEAWKGGVVDVIYATPTMDGVHGYASASYAHWNRTELQGAINVPITSNFAIRAAGPPSRRAGRPGGR